MSVGMPRPLSTTDIELSAWITTLMSSQIAGERLVDRVVEDLEHHVVQAGAVGRVADVHAGTLAHGVEALEDLDARGIVVVAVVAAASLVLESSCTFGGNQMRIGMTTYL